MVVVASRKRCTMAAAISVTSKSLVKETPRQLLWTVGGVSLNSPLTRATGWGEGGTFCSWSRRKSLVMLFVERGSIRPACGVVLRSKVVTEARLLPLLSDGTVIQRSDGKIAEGADDNARQNQYDAPRLPR